VSSLGGRDASLKERARAKKLITFFVA